MSLKNARKHSLNRDYFVFASIIVSVLVVACVVVGVFIEKSIDRTSAKNLRTNANIVERNVLEVFDYTNRIAVYLGRQIAKNPNDLEYIYSLLAQNSESNYKTHEFLSWVLFDWVDKNGMQLMNSRYGISQHPTDMSHRKYTKTASEYPWTMQVSSPAIGNPSGKWVIPAATGITDKEGNYIGALAVGFNIANLIERVDSGLVGLKVSYVVIDDDNNIVIRSSDDNTDLKSNIYSEIFKDKTEFANQEGLVPFNIANGDVTYTYYKKFANQPYTILAGYDKNVLNNEFYSSFLPRLLEFGGLGLFFLVVLYFFRRYIVSPITDLSKSADLISQGNDIKKLPRTPSHETTNLALQLVQMQRYIKKIKRVDRELFEAKIIVEKASNAKSDFLSNMSHELRTPLNAIVGYSDLIKDDVDGIYDRDACRQFASDINNAGIQLAGLIGELLELSYIESSEFSSKDEILDMRKVLPACIRLNSYRVVSKNVTPRFIYDDDIPYLRADPVRMKQIFLNILSNAFKYSYDNGEVRVRLKHTEDAFFVMIEDDGMGMTAKDIEELLSETRKSRTRKKNAGSGVGLWLTKAVVLSQDGEIYFESEVDKGTVVTVKFTKERMVSNDELKQQIQGEESLVV